MRKRHDWLQPVLQNDIVLIRPQRRDDFQALYEVARDPAIWEQHPVKRYLQPEFKKYFKGSVDAGTAVTIIDKASNEVIGSSRYQPVEGLDTTLEIGWTFLAKRYWGGMYNRSIKELMIDQVIDQFEYILFYIHKDNLRSQRSVEKLAGKQVAVGGKWPSKGSDNLIFMITKQDWIQLRYS